MLRLRLPHGWILWPAAIGLLLLAPDRAAAQGSKASCTWGEPQKMDAIPGCGVPQRLLVTLPTAVERLMFARDDNPTLKHYMFRSRAIGAPAKSFKRMVNVTKTDLVLCPSDFQKGRILAFRVVRGKVITSRPTCEVGPSGKVVTPPAMAAVPGMAEPPVMAASRPPAALGMGAQSVTMAIERDNPVRQRDLVKLRRAIKMDSLARLLGLLGLLLGLGATTGVVVLALTLRRRIQRLEAQRRSPE